MPILSHSRGRWRPLPSGSIALIGAITTAATLIAPTPAKAGKAFPCYEEISVKIPGNSTTYKLCVAEVKYSDFPTVFAKNPWWNDNSLAQGLARAISGNISGASVSPQPNLSLSPYWGSTVNNPQNNKREGPYFLRSDSKASAYSNTGNGYNVNESFSLNGNANTTFRYVFTTSAIEAPAPLPLLGAGAAFGWSRRLRRRALTRTSLPICGANQ